MTIKSNKITVIADNGGGVTLQVVKPSGYRYQHYYDDAKQAAHDVMTAQDNSTDVCDWDNNEAEGAASLTG